MTEIDMDRQSTADLTPTQLSRDQILAATARCLLDVGYDGTTIRRIAKELDCAVGSIYRYFHDKRELLYAVTQQAMEPVLMLAESDAPLETSVRQYYQQAGRSPQMYRLMFWLASLGTPVRSLAERARLTAAPRNKPAGVPDIVWRIIEAWGAKLESLDAGKVRWGQVHTAIMLGQAGPSESVNVASPANPQVRLSPLPPLPSPVSTDHVAPRVSQSQAQPAAIHAAAAHVGHDGDSQPDDVCLL